MLNITKTSFFSPFLLAVLFLPIGTYADDYYVQNERGVIQLARGNPDEIKPREWHVRLYRNGAATGGNDHWGLITGKSAASVMKKLKASQDFQIRFAKWAGFDYRQERDTHFNPLGPIAVMEAERPQAVKFAEKIVSGVEEFEELMEATEMIFQTLSKEPKTANPYSEAGRVFREYLDSLADARNKLRELQRKVNLASIPMGELERELDAISKNLGDLNSRGKEMNTRVGASKSAVTAGGWRAHAFSNGNYKFSQNIDTSGGFLRLGVEKSLDRTREDYGTIGLIRFAYSASIPWKKLEIRGDVDVAANYEQFVSEGKSYSFPLFQIYVYGATEDFAFSGTQHPDWINTDSSRGRSVVRLKYFDEATAKKALAELKAIAKGLEAPDSATDRPAQRATISKIVGQRSPARVEASSKPNEAAAQIRAMNALKTGNRFLGELKYDEAIAEFSKAVEANPKFTDGYYNRAIARSRKGEIEQATSDYTKVIELEPTNVEAYNNRAKFRTDHLKFEEAMRDYTAAIAAFPLRIEVLKAQKTKTYRVADGKSNPDELLKLYPIDLAKLYANRGNVYVMTGKAELAIPDFDKAIELHPKLAAAYAGRGVSYFSEMKLLDAIRDCGKALELDGFNPLAARCKADAESVSAMYLDSIREISAKIDNGSKEPGDYFERGKVYLGLRNFDAAIADFSATIELDKDRKYTLAFFNRAVANLSLAKYEDAIADLDHVVRLSPNMSDAYAQKGAVYFAQKDFESAIREYSRAIELKPGLANTYRWRSEVYLQTGNLEAALSDLSKYIEYDSKSADGYLRRASVYDKLGRGDMADADRKAAKQRFPR